MERRMRGIKEVVRQILFDDVKARSSDRYLYIEVVKKLNPELANAPLIIAMADANIPCFETVRRTRQYWQSRFPSLRANETVQMYRKALEDEYKELVGVKIG